MATGSHIALVGAAGSGKPLSQFLPNLGMRCQKRMGMPCEAQVNSFGGPGRRRSLGLVLRSACPRVPACAELPGRLPSRALGRRLGRDGHPPVGQVPSSAHPTGSCSSDAPVRKVRLRSATAGGLEWKQHPRQCRFRFYLGCSQAADLSAQGSNCEFRSTSLRPGQV